MQEDLVTPYGILIPLSREDASSLGRDLDEFEDSTGLTLAPYILDETFLRILGEKTETMVTDDDSADWNILWAVVRDEDTLVGCLDFSAPPGASGLVRLRWTFNPEWIATPLAAESVRSILEWAFRRNDCRTVEVCGDDRPFGEMTGVFRRLGFRPGRTGSYRLTKAVEGKLL